MTDTDEQIKTHRRAVISVRLLAILSIVGLSYGAIHLTLVGYVLSGVFLVWYTWFTYISVKLGENIDSPIPTDKFDRIGYSILCAILMLGTILFVWSIFATVF